MYCTADKVAFKYDVKRMLSAFGIETLSALKYPNLTMNNRGCKLC